MLVRGVVKHHIHNNSDAHRMRHVKQVLEIVKSAVCGVNIAIVGNVVAVVDHGGFVNGREPNAVNTQLFQNRQFGYDTLQVADAVSVAVAKAFAVDLVDNCFLPPFLFHKCLL